MTSEFTDTLIVPAPMLVTIHSPDERPAIEVPQTANTLEGFREWAVSDEFPERGRITYVAGELIIDLCPEFIDSHNFIKLEITTVLYRYVHTQRLGRVFPDRVLFTNEKAGVSNEPDASFASRETLLSGKARFVPCIDDPRISKEILGTLDWVLEIVSPSSKRKDKVLLRKAYFDAGIDEYWLIDALDDEVDFQLLVPGNSEYKSVEPQDGWLASPTFKKSFKLERAIDEDGFLEYTLHMK
jgi:Uma2 family endonuclease